MTYQFTGHVSFFVKGRYWKKYPVRVKAASYNVATRLAIKEAKQDVPARTRIEGIEIHLERLGPVVSPVEIRSNEQEEYSSQT